MSNIKTAISLQEELCEQTEQVARELHISRSRLVALALKEFLQRYENQRLIEQINAAQANLGDDSEEDSWREGVRKHQQRMFGRD